MSEHAYELHGDDPGAVERLAEDIAAADEAMDAIESGEETIPAEQLWAELGLDHTSP